jgi:hypothetical protein
MSEGLAPCRIRPPAVGDRLCNGILIGSLLELASFHLHRRCRISTLCLGGCCPSASSYQWASRSGSVDRSSPCTAGAGRTAARTLLVPQLGSGYGKSRRHCDPSVTQGVPYSAGTRSHPAALRQPASHSRHHDGGDAYGDQAQAFCGLAMLLEALFPENLLALLIPCLVPFDIRRLCLPLMRRIAHQALSLCQYGRVQTLWHGRITDLIASSNKRCGLAVQRSLRCASLIRERAAPRVRGQLGDCTMSRTGRPPC